MSRLKFLMPAIITVVIIFIVGVVLGVAALNAGPQTYTIPYPSPGQTLVVECPQ